MHRALVAGHPKFLYDKPEKTSGDMFHKSDRTRVGLCKHSSSPPLAKVVLSWPSEFIQVPPLPCPTYDHGQVYAGYFLCLGASFAEEYRHEASCILLRT